jgi:hypothetical protein
MIQFPGDCSYPVVYGTLLHFYCCSSFLSLSLRSHWQALSVAVDLRQIEFDRIIQTMEEEEGKDGDGDDDEDGEDDEVNNSNNTRTNELFLRFSVSHARALSLSLGLALVRGRGRADSLRCLRSERGVSPYGCLCSFLIGKHAIRINNCIQSRSHYRQIGIAYK